ncbi:RxLR-like protein [Plasmopara halstedii]|uniref:RxLR-like protein n=1 Tax=Plasmopara halstedii TaxID=4781 RepID=A0A0P1A5C0_PLAHL|nr:RxLR-like protein [Plasmopara halstedii]CEG35520.1 RxLR-like protein [Plasmopara halstedii]|eukprot:XP_024571889.1 RxLR-like protein [Plasmopara halstedii]
MLPFGLAFFALAITSVNAGDPKYLRSTSSDDSTKDDSNSSLSTKIDENVLDDHDLTVDVADYVHDNENLDGSQYEVDIMSLIGSGSNQVDLVDLIAALKETNALDTSASFDDDLSWLIDSHLKSEINETPVKKGIVDEYPSWLGGDDSESAPKKIGLKDYWLHDSDSESGSDDSLTVNDTYYNPDFKTLQALDDVLSYSENDDGSTSEDNDNEKDGQTTYVKDGSEHLPEAKKSVPAPTTIDSTLEEYWGSMADSESDVDGISLGKSAISKEMPLGLSLEYDSDSTSTEGDEMQLDSSRDEDKNVKYEEQTMPPF